MGTGSWSLSSCMEGITGRSSFAGVGRLGRASSFGGSGNDFGNKCTAVLCAKGDNESSLVGVVGYEGGFEKYPFLGSGDGVPSSIIPERKSKSSMASIGYLRPVQCQRLHLCLECLYCAFEFQGCASEQSEEMERLLLL